MRYHMIAKPGLLSLILAAAAPGGEWQNLCNGRDLSGWKVECREPDRGKSYWSVSDGVIECDTAGDRKHDYVWLINEREFGDFELECRVQSFSGSPGNSGIQIRSKFMEHPKKGHWLHGPQVDIHPPDPWRCGLIYDETWETRRWIYPPLPSAGIKASDGPPVWGWIHADGRGIKYNSGKPRISFEGNWNRVRIVARGPVIETEINGVAVSRFNGGGILDDEAHLRHGVGMRGQIALQLHANHDLKIRFKDLRIRELEPLPKTPEVVVVSDDAGLRKALGALRPGSTLRIAPGSYQPGVTLRDVHGTREQPIVIEGLDPRSPPLFEGGNEAWHLIDVSHVKLGWLHFRGQKHNGINIDDGGSFDTPSHEVVLSRLKVEDVGPNGNFDGIKCSGVDRLRILDCRISGWGGQAIDFVGCHDSEIARCEIVGKPGFSQHTGPQFKGGSERIRMHDCLLKNAGQRSVQIGGSTGLDYFRPKDAEFEARAVEVSDNRIIGGECAIAFTGADICTFRRNTVVRPEKWVFRILQERRDERFVRCGSNGLLENLIVFERSKVRGVGNIGPDTRPETFEFIGNHWFAADAPEKSRPDLPVEEKQGIHGVDPKLNSKSHRPAKPLPVGEGGSK